MGELEECMPNDDESYFNEPILTRRGFIWTDKEGNDYKLSDISSYYLNNIISFLKRKEISEARNTIKFLEKEIKHRSKESHAKVVCRC